MGAYPGVETPNTPDEPDLLDGNVVRARAWGHWPGVGLSNVAVRFDYLWSIANRLISCVYNLFATRRLIFRETQGQAS
jgi:hypothetical protein